MKHFSMLLFIAATSLSASAAPSSEATITSPNGKLTVTIAERFGRVSYSVKYDGQTALRPSQLGLITNVNDLSTGLTMVSHKDSTICEDYTLTRSKQSQVHYEANAMTITLQNPRGEKIQVEWRVSDNDIAMRYLLPKEGETGSVRVLSEATSFTFPDGTTTFLTPQSDAMIGWKRTKPSYEEPYTWDAPMNQASDYGHGYTWPALFHINGSSLQYEGLNSSKGSSLSNASSPSNAQDLWLMLSETGVDSHYCASHLSDVRMGNTYTIAYPMEEENNGIGTTSAAVQLPAVTPWRTITVGATLKPIVETTAPWDNVKPLYNIDFDFRPGRGTWSWILWQDESINYDDLCRYVDLAKAMGYEYVLADNWWDTNLGKNSDNTAKDPDKSIEKYIEYAHSQGIDVWLWYSSSGYWNDIVQGPTSKMSNSIVRKKEMKWMKSLGVKGIKVDFFGGDKQETLRLYEDILCDAAEYGLMVIFHGCTLPRGWERMYPNYAGSEAVLASENLIFGQNHCDLEAKNATLHPVLRNTVGCMEFGGSFQNRYMNHDNQPGRGTVRRTTSTFSLATAVLYQNPIQNFALAPNNLADAPEVSMDFMRNIPTTWDETRYIDGYPGRYLVIARRHGRTWYIAGVSAEEHPIKLYLDLSWLPTLANATLYCGGDNPTTTPLKADKKGLVKLTLNNNDGCVIVAE